MTDKEIIKALECCVVEREYPYCDSRKCPYFDATNTYTECKKMLIKDVCNTVKRQQAEIERLTSRNFELSEKGEQVCIAFKTAKIEAVKEFAEKLKGKVFEKRCDYYYGNIEIMGAGAIDNLAKEMVGEADG